ncbi:hypothetical protein GCM10007103_30970 [Salinimicrobium marinum]|uniref:TonB C-terminal domain-containing protein n=1 Tax=Salinimicrobium marinum TaxID=680283 RepID=A0A918SK32_9FLAO|nr:hypothetical protein GCM10007103_30970 [Salinimicrobium marinum]
MIFVLGTAQEERVWGNELHSKIDIVLSFSYPPAEPLKHSIFHNNVPDFSAEGLNYETELTDIFMGNIEDVPFKREDLFFGSLFNAYVTEYARYCANSLPPDKIELTRQDCNKQQEIKNGFGITISRQCVGWVTVGTGFYAAPDMYAAMGVLEEFLFSNALSIVGQEDIMGFTAKMTGEMKAVHMDMAALIRINGCDSPGLKRFQENLRLFALGQEPIRIETLIAKRKENKTEVARNQDVKPLMEDLVYENSRQWNFNRYQRGSVDNVQIMNYDNMGRPGKLKAEYLFSGFSGNKKGSVILTFDSKGLPDCLYFFDFPSVCRPASRKIANAYAKNTYATLEKVPVVQSEINNQESLTKATRQEISAAVPFAVVETVPIFPGCANEKSPAAIKSCTAQKITEMINQNFNTEIGGKLGLSGINRVYVQFQIDHKGNIGNVNSRASHPALKQEAERVVKLLPKMTAGKQRGRPVNVIYSVPITFIVEKNNVVKKNSISQEKTVENKPQTQKNLTNNKLRKLFNVDGNDR